MNKQRDKSILYFILICVAILCLLFGMCMLLVRELEMSERFTRSEVVNARALADMQKSMEISIPQELTFVEYWKAGARDVTHIYVYTLDLSDKPDSQTEDDYIAEMLVLDMQVYTKSATVSSSIYLNDLEHIGYESEHYFDSSIEFCEIHYRLQDQSTAVIALCYS